MAPTNVIYYLSPSGANPFAKFLDSLNKKQQAKILRLIIQIEEYGLISIIPHVKKLSGTPLWEIRILGKDNIRTIYIAPDLKTVIILHGFIKKTQKTPSKELSIALKRYRDWQNKH